MMSVLRDTGLLLGCLDSSWQDKHWAYTCRFHQLGMCSLSACAKQTDFIAIGLPINQLLNTLKIQPLELGMLRTTVLYSELNSNSLTLCHLRD